MFSNSATVPSPDSARVAETHEKASVSTDNSSLADAAFSVAKRTCGTLGAHEFGERDSAAHPLQNALVAQASRWGKFMMLGLILAPYYFFTGRKGVSSEEAYPLPDSLPVRSSTLPTEHHVGEQALRQKIGDNKMVIAVDQHKSLDLRHADFSGHFKLETDRYRVIKDDDWLLSRGIGHVLSCIPKIFFMDSQIGAGLDEHEVRTVLAMLEKNKNLDGVTVRINHNAVFADCARLFNDPQVTSRNGLAARILVGLPSTFFGELFAEIRRGDYYNPMTQTAVLYSNVRAVAAHELGHAQDFHRFDRDWWYAASRAAPPVMLYQEWRASANARDDMLAPADQWQFQRYLLPAFFTYLLASYAISKRMILKNWKKQSEKSCGVGEPDADEVNPAQVLRHALTMNGGFQAGLLAGAAAAGIHPVLGAAALLGTWAASKAVADAALRKAIPYPYE